MMMSNNLSSKATYSTPMSNVSDMSSKSKMRMGRAQPQMFAGAPSSGFTISTSKTGAMPMQKNYFDKMSTSGTRRSNIKMMASYNVTFITPDGEQTIECP